MKIEFLKNISLLLITNILIRPLYIFGVDLKIQNILGPKEYGIFFILFDFAYLFLFVNDPGLQSFSVKSIAENRENPRPEIGKFLSAKIVLSLCYILICVLFAYLTGYDSRRLWLTFLISSGFVLAGIFVMLRSVFSGLGHYTTDSYLSSLDKVLMILTLGSLTWGITGKVTSVEQVVIIQNICYILAVSIAFCLLWKKMPGIPLNIEIKGIIQLLKQTLPYTGLMLLTAVCNRIDVVMLDFMRNDGEFQSGIYAAGYRFLDAANMFGYLFGGLLLPMYAHSSQNKSAINDLFNIAFKYLFLIALFISSVLIIFGKEIFTILYSTDYHNHYQILTALMLSLTPIMVSHSTGSLLVATGKLYALNITYGAAIIINVVLNWIFIPKYGALGSAYTTFFTEILILVISVYLGIKLCKLNVEVQLLWKIILLITFPFLWNTVICKAIDWNWIIKGITFSLIFLLITIFLKFIDLKELSKVVKFKNKINPNQL
jgi:O-antigen/teichoic acid export membrane protein